MTKTHTHLWSDKCIVQLALLFLHGCIVEVLLVAVLWQRGELEAEFVDGEVVLPRVVLQCARQKALREEES